MKRWLDALKRTPGWVRLDETIASAALSLMVLIPVLEILMRPWMGSGIENAPVLVQHLGLVLTMWGALAAERYGHLTTLGGSGLTDTNAPKPLAYAMGNGLAALVCGMLAMSSWLLVASEREVSQVLAYGIPTWWVQASMPLGFALLGFKLGARCSGSTSLRGLLGVLLPLCGAALVAQFDGTGVPLWPCVLLLVMALLAGAPIFAVLGGLALALFWQDGTPLATVALSHYQITVNPSLPALPLFTLAGLVFARTGAAKRLGNLFVALMGQGTTGTVVATALLCSCFTAFTGGSGVTILALGGLLLPLLRNAGYPEGRGISLVTSASALGVLLAPSVPLIMYAIIARVPIHTMFLAGLVPALVMVMFLLVFGGYLRRTPANNAAVYSVQPAAKPALFWPAVWAAKWEILAPVVAIGTLVSGLATPTESAAVTALYAILTQAWAHRELGWRLLGKCLSESTQIIGGVLLILGMALALTNFLIDAGIPDAAIEAVQTAIPNKYVFLLALTVFLLLAGALMEIYAAIVVLVPLLLPVAMSYGIDPVHFGIVFLAALEMGFLCPPAGMNIYFSSAMFGKPVREVAVAVLPALLAIFLGTLAIASVPWLATGLPDLLKA
ncbi:MULTISPECIES: TRAP transporter large permease subunit [unclassified Limnohabitans]|uniref:TRAP transporter large permease n=1 Tax=unclassified Limnohabitans TaxID=2626134 RepID=UPI000311553C|nr:MULTISPECIES: TRAP transporter large permease subunit [unclassified Limnohabitans]PVE08813.1 C4-dicarboxylate ABC transporter permease [Limnohabitans sp. Rim28]